MASAPLPFDAFEAVRMQASKRVATAETGAHLRRRMGQSLEFREHRQFVPGDDIRHVDWRVSARIGRQNDLFVRQFDAEDRLEIVVAIDFGPTMHLPGPAPKSAFAVLLARALLWCTERGRDQITLVLLSDDGSLLGSLPLKGQGVLERGEPWLQTQLSRFLNGNVAQAGSDLAPPTGGVCILVSDFFGRDADGAISLWAKRVQHRHGIFTAIQLDSWDYEAQPLTDKNVKFGAVGSVEASGQIVEAEASRLAAGQLAAADHVQRRLDGLQFGGLTRLLWQIDTEAMASPDRWIAENFARNPDLANALTVRI